MIDWVRKNWMALAGISALLFLILALYDSAGLKTVGQQTTVTDKRYTAAYTTTNTVCDKRCYPVTEYHPAQYDVHVSFEDMWCSVDEGLFNRIREGQMVIAKVGIGRLTGASYCLGIRDVDESGLLQRQQYWPEPNLK